MAMHFQVQKGQDGTIGIENKMSIDMTAASMGRPLPLPRVVHPLVYYLVNSAPMWLGPYTLLFQEFKLKRRNHDSSDNDNNSDDDEDSNESDDDDEDNDNINMIVTLARCPTPGDRSHSGALRPSDSGVLLAGPVCTFFIQSG